MTAAYEPPASDDRGPLVIRPSWASLSRWQMHVAPFLAIAVILGSLKVFGRHPQVATILLLAGVLGIMAACYAVYMAAYMLGSSITVTSDQVLVRHWFRSTATVSLRGVARVVRCSVSDQGEIGKPAVLAFSPAGRCVLSLLSGSENEGFPAPFRFPRAAARDSARGPIRAGQAVTLGGQWPNS